MAAKVDQTAVEKSHNQSTASPATTPVRVANSSKISMRAVKAGVSFVIPKNKLSGAMVPVGRGGGKLETNDSKKDEEVKQPQRKTKWGIDLTQDAAVKKGRALAYQTRAEQIAVQLESGNLEIDDDEATRSPSPPPKYDSSEQRINSREARKREQLDLERREAIGEYLRLNPHYKPPPGYKPVNKEAKIYIPVEYPGYNFVGLILGPEGNTQKRLEEETGTKITIKGGMGNAKETKTQNVNLAEKKVETVNEDLHVLISADTYEKVDAAIALLDLLMTPVDGNTRASGANTTSLFGDASKVLDQSTQVADTGYSMLNSDLAQNQTQQMMMPSPGQHLGWPTSAFGTEASGNNFQPRPGHWHSMGVNASAIQAQSGFSGAPSSASYTNNNANMFFPRFASPSFNSFHPFPFFRGRPPAQGFNPHAMPSNPRNPMVGPVNRYRPPLYFQQRPFGPEMASQNQSALMNTTTGPGPGPAPGPQHMMGGVSQPSRPGVSQPAHPAHHTGSNAPPLPQPPNITRGGGYGPPVPHHGELTSAPSLHTPFPSGFSSAVPSQISAPQLPGGAYHQELQSSRPSTPLLTHAGPSIQAPLPGWSSAPPQGARAVVPPPVASPVLPSPGLPSTVPQGAHAAVPTPVASPMLPSPGLPSSAQGANSTVQPPVASPVLPSPRLPLAAPHSMPVAVPPSIGAPMPPPPRLSPAAPQTAPPPVGPPSFPRPAVPSAGNVLNVQHPRVAFISQGSSVGLSPGSGSVISPTSTSGSSVPLGTILSPIANTQGAPVAALQSGAVSRPIPPPVSATTTNITSQGANVPSSVAPNTWQPQHLSSGDFTFQPLRSQAPPPPQSVWPQPSQPPLPPDVRPQNQMNVNRPGFQPAVPNLPHSLSGPIKVNTPPPPASSISVPPPAPPLPPLPPQAPSFRPAISLPSPPRGFSSQSMFTIPSQVSGSQTTTAISPPAPFLGSSQPMPPRPAPGMLSSPVINQFSSSPSQTIPTPPLQPRPQPGTGNLRPFPLLSTVSNVQIQEAPVSQAFQHPSRSNVQIQAPASQAFQRPSHSNASISSGGSLPTCQSNVTMGTSSAALPGEESKQVMGPTFVQQKNSSAVLHNMSSAQPTSNAQHKHMSASPPLQLPPNPQLQSIIPGQNQAKAMSFSGMHDFGYGGSSKALVNSKEGSSSQSYDPFSPTSIPPEQLQNNQNSSLPPKTDDTHDTQETDAEYENLMESVGVR